MTEDLSDETVAKCAVFNCLMKQQGNTMCLNSLNLRLERSFTFIVQLIDDFDSELQTQGVTNDTKKPPTFTLIKGRVDEKDGISDLFIKLHKLTKSTDWSYIVLPCKNMGTLHKACFSLTSYGFRE